MSYLPSASAINAKYINQIQELNIQILEPRDRSQLSRLKDLLA